MNHTRFFWITLVAASCLFAQSGGEKRGGFPPPPYKNLKLIEPALLQETMLSWPPALGVQCTFCHVKDDFASDEKPEKAMARRMVVMIRQVNSNWSDGKRQRHVTCFACHRGSTRPQLEPGEKKET